MQDLEKVLRDIEKELKQEQTNSMQNSTMWRFMSNTHIPVWKKRQY